MINLFAMLLTARLYLMIIFIGLLAGTLAGRNEDCPQRSSNYFTIFGFAAKIPVCTNRNKCTTSDDCEPHEHCACEKNCGKVCVRKSLISPQRPRLPTVLDDQPRLPSILDTIRQPQTTPEYCPKPRGRYFSFLGVLGHLDNICKDRVQCDIDSDCEHSEYCKCSAICGRMCYPRPSPPPDKPGKCPLNDSAYSPVRRKDNCMYDTHCPDQEKCCDTMDGLRCKEPVSEIAVISTTVTPTEVHAENQSIRINDTSLHKNYSDDELHPCTHIECSQGELCQVSMNTKETECVAEEECDYYDESPVCGSDNITYSSICDLKKNQTIRIKHLGKCQLDGQWQSRTRMPTLRRFDYP